ncbi:hypothetical protein ISN44_As01g028990 [Arabidopsis suecica]|uniref:Mediator of RNA polymerase II transcription subunit 9 n=1 Tax=Arabidopsis suecica TaxID=45249 RepID=A0A8T2H9F2_ARASU|nr:hypothetical protein ISN44_As01g028990 [Arabidopsis suecica]
MQKPQSHTTQQQQSVQTPLQHQTLASHLYPLVENLKDVTESRARDQNSDALYVDGQKQNLEESEQLLQQRMKLIEEYKKSVEEIVKKEP